MSSAYLEEKLAKVLARLRNGAKQIEAAKAEGKSERVISEAEERWCRLLADYEAIFDALHGEAA